MKITFLFLFLQILNYKVFRIYHKKLSKSKCQFETISRVPFPAPAEKGKIEVPPKSPEGGLFSNVCRNVFLLPAIFFFRVPDQGFLACIIHHACKPPKIEKPEEKYN